MVDIESMIKSLRLAWRKRIFGNNSGAWKNYLEDSKRNRWSGSF